MEIHIGDRVADVTLVSKEGNKVQFMIDGKPYRPLQHSIPKANDWCRRLWNG